MGGGYISCILFNVIIDKFMSGMINASLKNTNSMC